MIVNLVRCVECKNIIHSTHRHHFNSCYCGNTFVDGGNDYLRYGGVIEPEIYQLKVKDKISNKRDKVKKVKR